MLPKKSPISPLITLIIAGLFGWTSTTTYSATDKQIILKVVGPDGEILKDAKIYHRYSLREDKQQGKQYSCNNNGIITLDENEIFKSEWQRKGVTLYGLDEDKFSGFIDVNSEDLGKELELKLPPACRISIKITSTELKNLGLDMNWTYVTFSQNNRDILSKMNMKGEFELLLPAGEYNLYSSGMQLYSKYEQISIKVGQKELQLNLDLAAERVTHLIGKQAPELKKMKGWLNSSPLSLKELNGKVVLIDFWGTWCGPCVAEIPNMIKLYEKYHDKGLVIIGIHDDSMNSIKDLEGKIDELSKNRWDDRKIPFPLALDSGKNSPIKGTHLSTSGANTAEYGIQKWPTIVLIDKQGKVVKEYNRSGDTEIIEKLLSE